MDLSNQETLSHLLTHLRIAALCVLRDGAPYVAMMPFAADAESGSFLIHASRLGLHAKGLTDGVPFSLLIHSDDDRQADPLELPRVSVQGKVWVVPRSASDFAAAKESYLRKFPTAGQTFELGDFELHRLMPESARFIAGFGKIFNLNRESLRQALTGASAPV